MIMSYSHGDDWNIATVVDRSFCYRITVCFVSSSIVCCKFHLGDCEGVCHYRGIRFTKQNKYSVLWL